MSSQDSSGDGPSVVCALDWEEFCGRAQVAADVRVLVSPGGDGGAQHHRPKGKRRRAEADAKPEPGPGVRPSQGVPHDAASDGRYVTRPVAQPKAINAGSAIMAGRVRDPVARSTPQSRQWSGQASVRRAKQQGTHDYRTRCISVAACRPPLCTHPFPPAAGSRTTASSSCLKETRCPPHSGTPA